MVHGGEDMKNFEAMKKLETEINNLIIESNLNYAEVISVLGLLKVTYMDKGRNLLDTESIQKVSEMPRLMKL